VTANALMSKESISALSAQTQRQRALSRQWLMALDGTEAAKVSPVTRVVTLLKEMQQTLQKEMGEDEDLFKKLGCWCNQNTYEKENAIADAEAKVAELESTIETLAAKSAELKSKIAETEKQVSGDKEALATATAQREKEQNEFHDKEVNSIQDIENLKAALVILGKHQTGAFPQLSLSFLALRSKKNDWEDSSADHAIDEFMAQTSVETPPRSEPAQVDPGLPQQDTAAPDQEESQVQNTGDSWVQKDTFTSESAQVDQELPLQDTLAPNQVEPQVQHTEESAPADIDQELTQQDAPTPDQVKSQNSWTQTSTSTSEHAQAAQELPLHSTSLQHIGDSWTQEEKFTLQRALEAATSFTQAHHSEGYNPAYNAQSGEVLGVMQTLKEEMEADLKEVQQLEKERAAAFEELRSSKKMEIEAGEKKAEQKEDELASTDMNLAEAEEDLDQTSRELSENQKFMTNLKSTCDDADTEFEARKKARLSEMNAVADTIEILTEDDARDAMKGTFSFVQVASSSKLLQSRRKRASRLLRRSAARMQSPALSVLATGVELDAFTKVRKAITDNIEMMKKQQADEVKKHDWCNSELHETELSTMKKQEIAEYSEAKAGELESKIKNLEVEIEEASSEISELEVNLQRASENRKQENSEYQMTFEDQTLTIAVLHKALDRLAEFYDKEFFVQTQAHGERQSPPVPQMEYSPNKGAGGATAMIEKLIADAKGLIRDARNAESEAQAAYEQTIEDTNIAIENLQKKATRKLRAKTKSTKDLIATKKQVAEAEVELKGLAKYNKNLHDECDYILNNFDLRQQARNQEMEAMQQALQILKGASD